jgi:peptidoglycan L-alanyl-D-glutamate endopeptidase CwlK
VYSFGTRSKSVLAGVDNRLQEIANEAINTTKVDFGFPKNGGMRTREEQFQLYKDGKSNADGYVNLSHHQTGRALDFFAFVDGKANWDEYNLAMVAAAFLQAASMLGYKLTWGGLWKNFQDYPHVQVED